MAKKTKILILGLYLLGVFFIFVQPVMADEGLGLQVVPTACTGFTGGKDINEKCGLNAMFQTIIYVSQIILAISGSGALLMFMFGGVLWIIAAGNTERIQQGKQAMAAAAIGLAIILGSWVIINTTICALSSGQVACGDLINNLPWGRSQSPNPVDQLQEAIRQIQQQ